uniref:Dual specificity protein phosphatase n=1 Tax=Equus caballus TaxID=9796 RepID=A0A5F5PGH3_HORSE
MTLERQRGASAVTEGWVGWLMAEAFLPELRGDAEATPCPSVLELEELLRAGKVSCSHVDEVWPNLYIGDATTANNRFELWKLGITHVLNAAHGGLYCQGGPDFYGSSVTYLGVPAPDLPDFDISAYFSSTADFIHRALSTPGETASSVRRQAAGSRQHKVPVREDYSLGQIPLQDGLTAEAGPPEAQDPWSSPGASISATHAGLAAALAMGPSGRHAEPHQ